MEVVSLERTHLDEFFDVFSELMHEGYDDFPTYLQNYFLEQLYSKEALMEGQEKGSRVIYLGRIDGKIVGFIVGNRLFGGVGFISWLGVLEQYRGRRIGTVLLDEYEQYVVKYNGHMLTLNTFTERAHFYKHLGFEEIGLRRQGYFGLDAILMDKRLTKFNKLSLGISSA